MAKTTAIETLISDRKVRLRAEQGAKAAGLPPQALADFLDGLPSLLWEGFAFHYEADKSSPTTFARMWAKSRALDLRRSLGEAHVEYDATLDGVAGKSKDGDAIVTGIDSGESPESGMVCAQLAALEEEALAEGGFSIRDVSIYMALKDDDSAEHAARVADTVGLGHVPPGTPPDKVAWFKGRSVRTVASKVRAYVRAYVAEFGDE